MMAEWFYARNKQKVGPVTEEQLKELLRTGELSPADMVWKQGMATWQPVRAVDGLLTKSPPGPPEPPPLPDAASSMKSVWWERLNRNKPAYLAALLAVMLFLTCLFSPVVNFVLGAFPEGLGAFLGFLYVLFMIGLFVALIVAGFVALFQAAKRAERLKYLWGKWEPEDGLGKSVQITRDGAIVFSDGAAGKYTVMGDEPNEIIRITMADGSAREYRVMSLSKAQLVMVEGSETRTYTRHGTITATASPSSSEEAAAKAVEPPAEQETSNRAGGVLAGVWNWMRYRNCPECGKRAAAKNDTTYHRHGQRVQTDYSTGQQVWVNYGVRRETFQCRACGHQWCEDSEYTGPA